MAVRYYHEFTSQLGRQWRINIHDTSFASTAATFDAADSGFVLQYGDGASKTIDPILGSRCEVIVQITESNTALQTLISDIVAAQEGRFFIEIQEDTGGGYDLYWAGRVLTDLISEPDTWPSEVTLTATDGLASLKDVPFDNAGTLYTGADRFHEIIAKCINKAGVQVPLYGTGGSNYSVRTVVNWWNNTMGSPATATDPLARSRVSSRTWWDEVNTDETYYAAKDSYSVLSNVAQGWFARVFQSAGRYYFMQVAQHGQNPSAWRDYSLTSAGAISNTTTGTENRETAINQSSVARLYLGRQRYFTPLKSAVSVYAHNGSNNILENNTSFSYSLANAVSFPPSSESITVGASDNITIRFKALLQSRWCNNYEFNNALALDLASSPANNWQIPLKISLSGSGTTYYLKRTAQGNAQWTTTSTDSARYNIEVPFVGSTSSGDYAEVTTNIEFETPPLPTGAHDTNTFYIATPTVTLQGISANVTGGGTWNTIKTGTANDFELQYRLFVAEMVISDDGEIPNEETTYSASNTGANDGQPELETNDILFGADVGGLPAGLIEVSDGSTWEVNTDEWAYNAAGGSLAFNQLLVEEILSMQSVPTPVREWQVRGNFDFYNTLVLDSVEYAPISATLNAWEDTWSGTWFEVNRDSALVSDDDPIALPTNRVVQGSSSQATQLGRSVYNSLGGINRIAIVDDTINEGDTVTSIPVEALDAGYWKTGDTLTLFNANTGENQRFTVSADTSAGDTSISVFSAAASFDFYPGSPVYVTALDSITGAAYPDSYLNQTFAQHADADIDDTLPVAPANLIQQNNSGEWQNVNTIQFELDLEDESAGIEKVIVKETGNDEAVLADMFYFDTFEADSGSVTSDAYKETLTVAGGTGISTSISGDTLTITNDNTIEDWIRADIDDDVNANTEWQDDQEVRFGDDNDSAVYWDSANTQTVFEFNSGDNWVVAYRFGAAYIARFTVTDSLVNANAPFQASSTSQFNDDSNYASGKGVTFTDSGSDAFDYYKKGTSGAITATRSTINTSDDTLEYLAHGDFVYLSGQIAVSTAGVTGLTETLSLTLPESVRAGTSVSGQMSILNSGGTLKRIVVQEDRYFAAASTTFNNVQFITNLAAATLLVDTDLANGDLLSWSIRYLRA